MIRHNLFLAAVKESEQGGGGEISVAEFLSIPNKINSIKAYSDWAAINVHRHSHNINIVPPRIVSCCLALLLISLILLCCLAQVMQILFSIDLIGDWTNIRPR
jgi:hypothetical protein